MDEIAITYGIRDESIGTTMMAEIVNPEFVANGINGGYQSALTLKIVLTSGKQFEPMTFPNVTSLNQFIKMLSDISEKMIDVDVDHRCKKKGF